MKTVAATVAATLALGAAAQAQQNALSEGEVRAFFDEVGTEAEAAVQAEDWQGIQTWISRHVADEAAIGMRGTVTMTDGPITNFEVAMTGAQLQRFTRMAMGQGQPLPMEFVEQYSLSTQVQGVNELPDGQASALVLFQESGRLAPPAEAGIPATVFDQLSTCAIRLAPGDEAPRITTIACDTIAML